MEGTFVSWLLLMSGRGERKPQLLFWLCSSFLCFYLSGFILVGGRAALGCCLFKDSPSHGQDPSTREIKCVRNCSTTVTYSVMSTVLPLKLLVVDAILEDNG